MNTVVVSYSFTGNNKALACSLANKMSADHIEISEHKHRTAGTIIADVIFNRTPKVQPNPAILEKYDLIIFVAPVWMGNVASPLRSYLKYQKTHMQQYAFASISGGAINTNPKLASELKKRAGTEPVALIDLHIADLMPQSPKPTMKDTSSYLVNDNDIKNLTDTIVKALNN